MEEVWLEWKTNCDISNKGNMRRKLVTGDYKHIKGSIKNIGYRYHQSITPDGKRKNNLFHHLVAKCFIGERPEGMVIDHIDRNKLNNCVENLRYVTHEENMKNQDRYRNDILTTDKRERRNILSRERDRKNGRFKGVIREKGMGHIFKKYNKYYGVISKNKIRTYSSSFNTYDEVEIWLSNNK